MCPVVFLLVFVITQVFAATHWVTSGNTSFCGNIWNLTPPAGPDAAKCDSGYNKCLAVCWLTVPWPLVEVCIDQCKDAHNSCTKAPVPPMAQDHYATIWVQPVTHAWVSISRVGQSAWSADNDKQVADGGRIIDISAVRFNDGTTRFDSVYTWEAGNSRRAFVELTENGLNQLKAAQNQQGYQIVKLRVYRCANTAPSICYNVIFAQRKEPTIAFYGQKQAEIDQTSKTYYAQGYRLADISAVQQLNGVIIFTSIYEKSNRAWNYLIGDPVYFQQQLNSQRDAGYYPYHVHVYKENDQVWYMGLFEEHKSAIGEWAFLGGLTSGEYGKYWGCMSAKFRPIEVASFFDLEAHFPR